MTAQLMKTIGIIGGIGPESTIDYSRFMVAEYRRTPGGTGYPSIVINSIDLDKALRFLDSNDLNALTEYLLVELQRLADAGADIGLLAANTPHLVFDRLQRRSPIPLISIVQATCDHARAHGVTHASRCKPTSTQNCFKPPACRSWFPTPPNKISSTRSTSPNSSKVYFFRKHAKRCSR
jgi:aspartate racemase